MITPAIVMTLALALPAAAAHETPEAVFQPASHTDTTVTTMTALALPASTTVISGASFRPIMSAEAKRAFSKQAKDKRGFEPSLYRGKWYSPKWKKIRACIMERESGGSYWAFNRSSTARGAYQFLDSQWRQSLVWMMIAESKQTGDGLIPTIKKLRKKPIHRWNRYFQDRAFYTALRHGKGLFHWNATVKGTGCF